MGKKKIEVDKFEPGTAVPVKDASEIEMVYPEQGDWKTVCDFFTIESQEPFRLQQHTGTKEIRVIPAGE